MDEDTKEYLREFQKEYEKDEKDYKRREQWAIAFCESWDLDTDLVDHMIAAMIAEAAYQKSKGL